MNKKNVGLVIGYGLGDFGSQFVYTVVTTFYMMFLTNILGVDAGVAGIIYAVVVIFDAINDPIIGHIADRGKTTKLGKYRKWVVLSTPFYAFILLLVFYKPNLSYSGRVLFAVIVYVIYTILATCWQTPYGALPGRLTRDPKIRVVLGTVRDWAANLSRTLISSFAVTIMLYFSQDGKTLDASGYFGLAVVCAICAFIFCLISGLVCKETIFDEEMPANQKQPGFSDSLKALAQNKPAVLILLAFLCLLTAFQFRNTFTTYYATYYLEDVQSMSLILMIVYSLPLIVQLFAPMLINKIGSKATINISLIALAISGLIMLLGHSQPFIILASVMEGIMLSLCAPALWGVLPNLADYGEYKTHISSPGIYYAMAAFALKAGAAIAGLLSGLALSAAGFDAAKPVTESCKAAINFSYGIFPLVICIIGLVIMHFYHFSNSDYEEAAAALKERRAHQAQQTQAE